MMFDLPTRLLVAYGLIALIVLAAVGFVLWSMRNTHQRRDSRARNRLDANYRKRDKAAADHAAAKR
jgi:hypothetical protein